MINDSFRLQMFRVIEFMANFADHWTLIIIHFILLLWKKIYYARINNYDKDDVFSFYLR